MQQFIELLRDKRTYHDKDVMYSVITRFNVKNVAPGAQQILERGEHLQWSERRVELFRERCLASMQNLRLKPHAWFVLFDQDLSPKLIDLYAELLETEWIVPMTFGDAWPRQYLQEIRDVTASKFPDHRWNRIGCARLDSDDSVHQDYFVVLDEIIWRLRRDWEPTEARCLNSLYGCWYAEERLRARIMEKTFFSVVEPIEAFRGPYQAQHTQIDRKMPVVNVVTNRPMWVYWRHEQNISGDTADSVKYEAFQDQDGLLRSFGLRG